MTRICYDSGHALLTPGKRLLKSLDPHETREWVLNDRITTKVIDKLTDYKDVEVIRLDDPTGKRDIPLIERTNKANLEHKKKPIDILISNHHNAGINGGTGGGITVYTQSISSSASVKYRNKLYNKLITHTNLKGDRSSPITTGNFHMTRESLMPSVLLELGFMDSKTDVPIILTEKFANQVANAQVEFLVEEFKLVKKQSSSKELYRVGITIETDVQVGAYNDIINATDTFDKLNKLGLKSYLRKE